VAFEGAQDSGVRDAARETATQCQADSWRACGRRTWPHLSQLM
jgi:hypothetical protein